MNVQWKYYKKYEKDTQESQCFTKQLQNLNPSQWNQPNDMFVQYINILKCQKMSDLNKILDTMFLTCIAFFFHKHKSIMKF